MWAESYISESLSIYKCTSASFGQLSLNLASYIYKWVLWTVEVLIWNIGGVGQGGGGGGKVPTTPKHNIQQPQKPTSQALPNDGQSSPASAEDQNCAQWLFKLRFTIKFIINQIQIHNRWSKHNQQSIKTRNGVARCQCFHCEASWSIRFNSEASMQIDACSVVVAQWWALGGWWNTKWLIYKSSAYA